MSFLDLLESEATMEIVEDDGRWMTPRVRKNAELEKRRADEFAQLEEQLFQSALRGLNDAMNWHDIDPNEKLPPNDWVEKFGSPERANAVFRVAKAMWDNAKEAPIGLKIDSQVVTGIMKARATEKAGPRQLNVSIVKVTQPAIVFPEKEVD